MNLKEQIVVANVAYRKGAPIMTDQEYDDLLEQYQKEVEPEVFEDFVSNLNEGIVETQDGKVKHPFIMGSLEKVKAEEPEIVKKWIKENIKTAMSVSAKVDGISSRAQYVNGRLVSLTTRGDGYLGMDITSKAKYIKGLPKELNRNFNGSIRGELVILKNDFELMKDKYANPRNACAGIMNRKDGDKKFNENELRCITFVPYTILGDGFDKESQFRVLENLGFVPARNFIIEKSDIGDDIVDILFDEAGSNDPYETDGLVICDIHWRNEDKYRPDGCKAFKTNQSIGVTKVIGFDWGTPSANGKLTPVALLEPIQLAGTTVKRVTCNNVSYLEKMGIEIGKTVKIRKSGEIIPQILEVLD